MAKRLRGTIVVNCASKIGPGIGTSVSAMATTLVLFMTRIGKQ